MTHPANKSLKISERGVEFIKGFESWKPVTYADPVGVLTIGWGTIGPEAKPGRRITQKQGLAFLKADIAVSEKEIKRVVNVPLTQGQFDALVSIHYNMGLPNLLKTDIIKLTNRGDYIGAAGLFPRHNKAKGKVFAGLTRRRSAEAAMFLEPDDNIVDLSYSDDTKDGYPVDAEIEEGGNVTPDEVNTEGRSMTSVLAGSETIKAVLVTITSLITALTQLFEPLKDSPIALVSFGAVIASIMFIGYLKVRGASKGR